MITGRVFRRRPTVLVTVDGPNGYLDGLEALVDTGFTGYMTLPIATVAALGLPFASYFDAGLADGSRVSMSVHEGTVLWHGVQQTVFILATGRVPLIGMSLVYGSRLTLEGADGGSLSFEELP